MKSIAVVPVTWKNSAVAAGVMVPALATSAPLPSPRFVRAVAPLARSDRLFDAWRNAPDDCVDAVPRPRLVLAVAALAMSERLLAASRPAVLLPGSGPYVPDVAASVMLA